MFKVFFYFGDNITLYYKQLALIYQHHEIIIRVFGKKIQ